MVKYTYNQKLVLQVRTNCHFITVTQETDEVAMKFQMVQVCIKGNIEQSFILTQRKI